MKTYHELMRGFADERVKREQETMHRIDLAVLYSWERGGKGRHIIGARRHYERCKYRMNSALARTMYHRYMELMEKNLAVNTKH